MMGSTGFGGLSISMVLSLAVCIAPGMVSAQEPRTLTVYARGPYEVWGGNEPCPDLTVELGDGQRITVPGYYDAPRFGYVFLGQSDTTASFRGSYKNYVVATRSLFTLDAIRRSDGTFIRREDSWDSGNTHLPWQFDADGRLIGGPGDYDHNDYVYGAPDTLEDDVGIPPGHGWYAPGGPFQGYVAVEYVPLLVVLIAGINDHGARLIDLARSLEVGARYDENSFVRICEADRGQGCTLAMPSDGQARDAIAAATRRALERGRDVVVTLDMNLEDYSWEYALPIFRWRHATFTRWQRSVRWAGRIANLVSQTFSQENPRGIRVLFAHSAGADAAAWSVKLMRKRKVRLYDSISLINGRTNASTLAGALRASGYRWSQVLVFTTRGDFLANPLWSLSSPGVAGRYGGEAWAQLHSTEAPLTGHSGLLENIGTVGVFEVNLGRLDHTLSGTAASMLLTDWGTVAARYP